MAIADSICFISLNIKMSNQLSDETGCSEIKEKTTTGTSIGILHVYDLFNTFSYLSYDQLIGAAKVCVEWHEIVTEILVKRRKLQIYHYHELPVNYVVNVIKRCGPRLEELILSGFGSQVDDKVIETFVPCCPNLIKLDLSGTAIGNDGVKCLASYFKLQELNVINCPNITNGSLQLVDLPELKILHISLSKNLNGKCLQNIQGQLEKLTLANNLITDPSFFLTFLWDLLRLKELSLVGQFPLCNRYFESLFQFFTTMRILQISSSNFDCETFEEISKMTWLEELHLCENPELSDVALITISRGCRNLRVLNVSYSSELVTDLGLVSIAENCTQLEELNVSHIKKLALMAFGQLGKVGNLRRLLARDSNLHSVDCIQLVTHCHQLELMDMRCCPYVNRTILQPCNDAMGCRNKELPLKLIVGGTRIRKSDIVIKHPKLDFSFAYNDDGDMDDNEYDSDHDSMDDGLDWSLDILYTDCCELSGVGEIIK